MKNIFIHLVSFFILLLCHMVVSMKVYLSIKVKTFYSFPPNNPLCSSDKKRSEIFSKVLLLILLFLFFFKKSKGNINFSHFFSLLRPS